MLEAYYSARTPILSYELHPNFTPLFHAAMGLLIIHSNEDLLKDPDLTELTKKHQATLRFLPESLPPVYQSTIPKNKPLANSP